jgi:hypothetical protein
MVSTVEAPPTPRSTDSDPPVGGTDAECQESTVETSSAGDSPSVASGRTRSKNPVVEFKSRQT